MLLRGRRRGVSEFESQFSYARELFREVFDSDPVRKKYPMLFLTQRAPGHSPIGPALHLDLIEANRRQLLDAGVKNVGDQCDGRMHELPHGFVLFASRIAGTCRADDERDRDTNELAR